MVLGLGVLLLVGRDGTQGVPGLVPVHWCEGWVLSTLVHRAGSRAVVGSVGLQTASLLEGGAVSSTS